MVLAVSADRVESVDSDEQGCAGALGDWASGSLVCFLVARPFLDEVAGKSEGRVVGPYAVVRGASVVDEYAGAGASFAIRRGVESGSSVGVYWPLSHVAAPDLHFDVLPAVGDGLSADESSTVSGCGGGVSGGH